MLVTELGMVIDVRSVQLLKAPSPMLVTELGMVIDVRLEQTQKAYLPMLVTELGMTVFLLPAIKVLLSVSIMALQLSRESYLVLP